MELIQILEQAKAQVIAKRDQDIELVRQEVIRNIEPKYQELDALKADELNKYAASYQERRAALINQHNAQLSALQEEFDMNNTKINELINNRKSDLFSAAFQDASYKVTAKCDKTIAKLNAQIADLKE